MRNLVIKFVYKHINGFESILTGNTPEQIIQHANEVSKTSPNGSLLPALVVLDGLIIRYVGPIVKDDEDWNTLSKIWIACLKTDLDIVSFLTKEKEDCRG